ncbi:MAG: F0F1 ATP synthase subunit gamma [Clostridia bacterium]|nr:F0F1 ATP synthase subunit gamma [Clostridia bacterium]
MNTPGEIKRRLASVTQTKQITNAMYLLSVSRLKRSMESIDYQRKYVEMLRRTMEDVLKVTKGADIHNYYIDKSPLGTALFMSVMGDKRLCGDYNHAVAALTKEKLPTKKDPLLYCFGMVGKEILTADGIVPDRVLPGSSMHPSLELARVLSKELIDMYVTDQVNEVYIIYTPYTGAGSKPVCFRLLPLLRHDFVDAQDDYSPNEMLYEPAAQDALDAFVPKYCSGILYSILMQSAASENAARMEAMQSAADNADDMIKELQTQLKTARQLSITNELAEITAATNL